MGHISSTQVTPLGPSCARFTIELLDFCACAAYEREDLLAIFDGLRFFAKVGIARGPGEGIGCKGSVSELRER